MPLYAGLSLILLIGVGSYFYLQNIITRAQSTEHRTQNTENPPLHPFDKGGMGGISASTSEPMNSQLQINKIAPSPASRSIGITVEEESQGIGTGQYIIVKFDVAKIREMPSLDSREVGWASKGSQFVVLQEYADNKDDIIWYQVPYHGGKRWISANVVDIVEMKE